MTAFLEALLRRLLGAPQPQPVPIKVRPQEVDSRRADDLERDL
ncbi:MAG: hypothetical protein AAF679_11775 [Pseudomonadota bacterium]